MAHGCSVIAPPGITGGVSPFGMRDVGVPGGGVDPVAANILGGLSGYRFSLPLLQAGAPTGLIGDSEVEVGLIDLSGTDICGDLFSATPASLTWDNKAVIYGWRMSWVIAGALLFVLGVWGGLKMTYDTWLVGRVSTAIRDMLPRFLIALVLAAGSLFLCRMAIILVGDVTCFVAHSTGMTMWGVIGNAFVNIMKGFGQFFTNGIAEGGVAAGASAGLIIAVFLKFKLFVLFMFLAFWVAVIIVMMLKVAYHMMMRLALIAILIVFSPIAFALYASPDTSHWTGKWVRLFTGALAQQAVTLIVLYVGASLIRGVDAEGFSEWDELIMAAFLVIAMFALAIKVPRIINPDGDGYFNEFSGLLRMGAAAAMYVGGALSGGINALGGGASTVTTAGPGGGGGGGNMMTGGGPTPGPAPGGGGQQGGGGFLGGAIGGVVGSGGWFSRATGAVGGAFRSGSSGWNAGQRGMGMSDSSGLGRFMYGMGQGARQGAQANVWMRNVGEGNFMYRNQSVSDDSADRIQDLTDRLGGLQPRGDDDGGGSQGGRSSGSSRRRRPRRGR